MSPKTCLSDAKPDSVRRGLRRSRCLFFALAVGLILGPQSASPSSEISSAEVADLMARAVALEHGEGVGKDERQAFELYCQLARSGNAEAQFSLGWMFANARGVARDDAAASLLFNLAARQGHQQAERIRSYFGPPAEIQPDCLNLIHQAHNNADDAEVTFQETPNVPSRISDLVNRLAPEYQIHPRLALAVIQAESNFDPNARSPKNAQGLMQLIPETARRFNVRKPFDPEQNVRGGLSYLRWLLSYFRGQVPLVLAGYNAGEGAVDRYRGIPPFPETRGYVQRIMSLYRNDTHPFEHGVSGRSSETRYFR